MGEIVNLKRVRKAKERAGKEKAAAMNRARFGVSREQRDLAKAQSEKLCRHHEGAKLEPE